MEKSGIRDCVPGNSVQWCLIDIEKIEDLPLKMKVDSSKWKKNKNKAKKLKGLKYHDYKGNVKNSKISDGGQTIEGCADDCRRKCKEKISDAHRIQIRNTFYSNESQNINLADNINREQKKTTRTEINVELSKPREFVYL